ncbi:hypothetical protein E2562_011128 [Oryza meyeriana var. granulata]|uniref:Alpha/beta hydrolase fold-3 domain-containing protein n=1 Tax=Oryza meyeriana var. granulata TaxID=110450 RepID=A0A6G1DGD1_9ORYZ|nr:hypothetical protein E2562_011128 [Oryza meyeriana var. granulata]
MPSCFDVPFNHGLYIFSSSDNSILISILACFRVWAFGASNDGPGITQRYQGLMKDSSKLPLFDLRKLNASFPVNFVPNNTVDILVVGASNDFIVDAEGLAETAKFYNVQPVCVEGIAHDMMLDYSWDKGAGIILSWLEKLTPR